MIFLISITGLVVVSCGYYILGLFTQEKFLVIVSITYNNKSHYAIRRGLPFFREYKNIGDVFHWNKGKHDVANCCLSKDLESLRGLWKFLNPPAVVLSNEKVISDLEKAMMK
jgi:hypothetical protein